MPVLLSGRSRHFSRAHRASFWQALRDRVEESWNTMAKLRVGFEVLRGSRQRELTQYIEKYYFSIYSKEAKLGLTAVSRIARERSNILVSGWSEK